MRYLFLILVLFSFSLNAQKVTGLGSPNENWVQACDTTDNSNVWIENNDLVDDCCYEWDGENYIKLPNCDNIIEGFCESKPTECVESQEWTYGIDNTGTDWRWNDAEYKITLSDGTFILFNQTSAATNWTPQMQEWGDNIQAAADAAGLAWFVDTRFRSPSNPSDLSGGGGFSGPPSVSISNALPNMLWRYVNIQICPGQPVPVSAEVVSVNDQDNSTFTRPAGYPLTTNGAAKGPLQRFFVCRECGEEPVWYLEDGVTPATAGQIPSCYEPCGTLTLAESPPDRECEFETVIGCDNNNSLILTDFIPDITRRATICNGEQIAVDYFQADPTDPNALIPYNLIGDKFVDCATGEVIAVPTRDTVLTTTSIVKCYGVDATSESNHTNTDNNTDASFSSNATQMKWNWDVLNPDGVNDFTLDVFACIDGGEVAQLTIEDVAGNVLSFDATAYSGTGGNTLFTGTSSASFAGKVLTADLKCGDGNTTGEAYLCTVCGETGTWYDVETNEVVPYESLYNCPATCDTEVISGTACLISDNTQPVLFFIERDCDGNVLSSNYVLPDGTDVVATDVSNECVGDFSLAEIKDCVIDSDTGQRWIRYAFFVNGMLDSEFFVNENSVSVIETNIGEYKSCNEVFHSSISEIEICVNGVTSIRKTKIDEDGAEVITFYNSDGLDIGTPTNYSIGKCDCDLFDYWEVEGINGNLRNREWDLGARPAGFITDEQGRAIRESFDFSAPTTVDAAWTTLAVNDTNSDATVQDAQVIEGYIFVTQPMEIRWTGTSAGYFALEIGECCGSEQIVIEGSLGSGTINPSSSYKLSAGTHFIRLWNIDDYSNTSRTFQYSFDGVAWISDNTPPNIQISTTKPEQICTKGYICDGEYFDLDLTPLVFSDSVLECEIECISTIEPEATVTINSISEIEVCADGKPATQKTLIDSEGTQTVTYYDATGDITPVNVIAGSCTKTSECVKWRNKYLGIDNTGTSFNTTYEIEVREGATVIGTFMQTPSANNTIQLNQWIAGLQVLYPNALIEQRYAPSGGAGLPPPTTGLDFTQMAARYVQFTACDGDALPTDLFIISENNNPIVPARQMDTEVIFGEETRGYVCYECGIEPTIYYTDGTILDLSDIPPCYITCAESFEEEDAGGGTTTFDYAANAKAILDEERARTEGGFLFVINDTNTRDLGLPAGTMGCITGVTESGTGLVYWTADGTVPSASNGGVFNNNYGNSQRVCGIDLSLLRFNGSSNGSDYTVTYEIWNP